MDLAADTDRPTARPLSHHKRESGKEGDLFDIGVELG